MKQLGKDALGDREKRMQFGLKWCKDGEYKFVYSGYDNGVSDFKLFIPLPSHLSSNISEFFHLIIPCSENVVSL